MNVGGEGTNFRDEDVKGGKDPYRRAGVDIDAGNRAAARYAALSEKTQRPEVLDGIGGFSGGFLLNVQKYSEPVLVSGTDGVGTKLKVALAAGQHRGVGVDCVAMCVNDILTCGAEPLFFLDYLAMQSLDVDLAAEVVAGVADGCEQAGCALIGGETAELADLYHPGEYDLAGTAVGVVQRTDRIDGRGAAAGDVVLGLASNGLHSNGFTLVRKLVAQAGVSWQDHLPGWHGSVAEELLRPTQIYVAAVHHLLANQVKIKAMAHITGGGLVENLPRVLPSHLVARLYAGSWPLDTVFSWLQQQGGMTFAEAARIWNMGVGYTLVVHPTEVTKALDLLTEVGQSAYVIGELVERGTASTADRVQWVSKVQLAVFASGEGTNLQALLDYQQTHPDWPGEIVLVVSDKPGCRALERAEQAGVAVFVADPRSFPDKAAFEQEILTVLRHHQVSWLILAGYMRIIGPVLLAAYPNRIMNIHPSLLPAYPGRHAVADALAAGASVTGVTVHLVDEGIDTGPILAQEAVPIAPGISDFELLSHIHKVEHRLYPRVIEQAIRAVKTSFKETE